MMDHVRMQIERTMAKARTIERRRIRAEIARIERTRSLLDVCLKTHFKRKTRNRMVEHVRMLHHRENDLINELHSI